MTQSISRKLSAWAVVLAAIGCSKSDPPGIRRADPNESATVAADVPIQPKLTDSIVEEPEIKFDSVEAEMAHWQARSIAEIKKRFEKLTEADIQKTFDELKPDDQAKVRRVQSWLPHKRIMEMGNPVQDLAIINGFPTQFDPELVVQRMFEYADDTGAGTLIKNLGITKPKDIVMFRLDFGRLTPTTQSLIWGINQKLQEGGMSSLTPTELGLVQAHPGLFIGSVGRKNRD